MAKKSIEAVEVAGKRVLVRVDFNVPMENGAITDDTRIQAALPTIKTIVERNGRVVLMSHLGRPGGDGYEAALSLRPVAEHLSKLLGVPVGFPSTDCVDDASKQAVASMQDGDVVLLENLRFHREEKAGDSAFGAQLADMGDVYVNDAFGTCHRDDASMVSVPRAMGAKPKVAGHLVLREIQYLSDTLESPERPFVVVLGGAKVSDKIGAIEHLLPKADAILVGGAMAYTFIKALGHEVGTSRVENDRVADAKRMIDIAASGAVDLHLPSDHVCSTTFAESAGDIEVFEDHIKDGFMGLDIGPNTQTTFTQVIAKAKTIVWNGPMGVFEWAPFRIGTKQVAKAIAKATDGGAVSIVGGGDSVAAIEQFEVARAITHVSTGGGASLAMLEGRQFSSFELLDNA